MHRYALKMFIDGWRGWAPTIAVVAVMATMIGLCVHQFAWTMSPQFRDAVAAADVALEEYQILSVTVYTVVAIVSWVALTVVGKASVHATRHTHAMWLLLGASPRQVFASTVGVLLIVSLCGATIGSILATVMSFWFLPAFDGAVDHTVELPGFTVAAWAPVATIALSVVTATVGGLMPARRAARIKPGVALRGFYEDAQDKSSPSLRRILSGSLFLVLAVVIGVAAKLDPQMGSSGPGQIFNVALNAGGSALIGVYILCPQIVGAVFRGLHRSFLSTDLVVAALGTRAAEARTQMNTTTIAPLVAGLGGVGALLCTVGSVGAMSNILEPGAPGNMTDTWIIVGVVIVSMLATSAAVVALSARGRGHEIALLQAAGMHSRQVTAFVAAESFAMSLTATVTAAVPVIAAGVVCAFGTSAALNGDAVVAWPVGTMLAGFIGAWLMMFIILAVPTIQPLREGPSAQLRAGGN